MVKNIAYIFQPQFDLREFRASVNEQQGIDYNYIVVTCSPAYNGVWKYPAANTKNYDIWVNNKRPCYRVPIEDCKKIKDLTELTNDSIINMVKKRQKDFLVYCKKKKNYIYKEKPEWLL